MKLARSSPWRSRSASHSASPGKETVLPPSPPLGTGQDGYPSSGSSLSVAPRGTRLPYGEPLAVHLPVAVGVERHLVVGPVTAAPRAPHQVMDVPLRVGRERLAADRTATALGVPQEAGPTFPVEALLHGHAEAFLEVELPRRVVGIGLRPHLNVPTDRDAQGGEEAHGAGRARPVRHLPGEHPASAPLGAEVALPHPAGALLGMASCGPLPEDS